VARHPLAGIQLKLERAWEHFEALKAEMEPFVVDAYPLERRFDEETGWRTYHLRKTKEPPQRFGVIAGEITNLVRSSLDLLVYQLALIGGGDPGRTRTQFPIFTDHAEYTKKDRRGRGHRTRMLKNVSPKHRAIIDSLQPYHRVHPDRDPLAILKAFRDAYEHRDVAPAVVMVHRPSAEIEALKPGTVRDAEFRRAPVRAPLTDGAEVLGFRLKPDPKAKVKVDIQVRFDIGFEPTHTTLIDLDRIRRHVERIVRRFEPDFP
jgi:hypothetical protein